MPKVIRYAAHVDPDVRYSQEEFVQLVQIYLSDPDGWEGHGYRFVLTEKNPDILIRLVTPKNIVTICGLPNNLSCATLNGRNMYLNSNRWMQGSAKSKLSLDSYRQYVVSHEMGHILGHEHEKCPGRGEPAPVMMQQTLGVGACKANTSITKTDLKV
jgi:hypothetical protein